MKPSSSTAWFVLLVTLLAVGPIARAMGIRQTKKQLARSPDGATLYEVRADGPEGGGSLTYRVQGKTARDQVDFVLSSDFSPGGARRPQLVSPSQCRQRVAALGAELAKRKIAGVALHPEACGSADREGAVVKE
jgi:hypothetical protein